MRKVHDELHDLFGLPLKRKKQGGFLFQDHIFCRTCYPPDAVAVSMRTLTEAEDFLPLEWEVTTVTTAS